MSEGITTETSPKRRRSLTETFTAIFEENYRSQQKWGGNEHVEYPLFRAMRQTLASPTFAEENISNKKIRKLVKYLIENQKYSKAFREWVEEGSDSWEAPHLPQNVRRIHAFGRNEIIRRKGKRGLV